ncbi:OmpA family protein [Paraburkholderia susongensis]|uniref:OmpA family protein n=1 Tax=Paraburkholderia susongensis TaxID=1515439 RepID=A0A1X7LLU8_9BURK|nr:OmpA family protein [Paraburkholderia susongensis]SMG54129.1 OmpA family protein [Paraburkholderia susongensis]
MTFVERYRAPLIWIALCAVGLIWLCLPPGSQPSWPVVLGLILLTGLGAAALPAYGQRRAGHRASHKDEAIQPDPVRELPIILVVGPYASAVFAQGAQASTLRRNGDAAWMLVRTPDELARSIATIRASHQRLPDAVLMPVIPDGDCDDAVIRREFSRWRHELDASASHRAYMLPCYIAIYACLGTNGDATAGDAATKPVWFGDLIDISAAQRGIENARQRVRLIRRQLDEAWFAIAQPERMTQAGFGHAVFDWLEDAALLPILSSLTNTAPLSLHGLLLADIGYSPVRPGAWTRWLTGKTGLRPLPIAPKAQPLPLPGIIARQAALQVAKREERHKPRWGTLHAVAASAVVAAVAIGVSAWANSRMVARVASNLDAYRRTPEAQADAKRERLDTLRSEYAELTHYANTGVPAGLGWGLYRGDVLRAALEPVISAAHPPPGVTIDNLSLFDSGKTTLKPGAESRLKGALDLIRANPDKRILIAGHTDNVGPSAANLLLSEARARAIRDWLVTTASLPVTRFAIQGYGDTRPVSSNENSLGREMNRRVEITLVPDSGVH